MSSDKARIDIEELQSAMQIIGDFNKLDLRLVELIENGKPISIPDECLDEWRFIGLSNSSFIEFRFWEEEKVEF